VSDLLKKRRIELSKSLKEAESATKIRKKYLQWIENGDYEHLTDDVYALGYIKSYADYLGFETSPIVNMYKKERLSYKQNKESGGYIKTDNQMSLRPLGGQNFVLSSKTLVLLFSIMLFVLIAGYLSWQVIIIAAPPEISLNSNQERVSTDFVIISGQTDGESDVYIDDSPISTNADGSFSERVSLVSGSNVITVSAKNQLGKTTTVTRTVFADLPQSSIEQTKLSTTAIDGVELLVSIQNQATFVVVVADGQDVFRGTMLPGTSQIFRAKNTIKLTTGNAGNTLVSVTNTTVANKELGIIGRSGEAKNDIEFSKDTQFK
jgi:cytoskeletal protein RodZ